MAIKTIVKIQVDTETKKATLSSEVTTPDKIEFKDLVDAMEFATELFRRMVVKALTGDNDAEPEDFNEVNEGLN